MYANLKPFSLMGLPNKNTTCSDKDLHATTKRDFFDSLLQNKQETLLLRSEEEAEKSVASALTIRVSPKGEEAEKSVVSALTIRASPKGEEEGGECTTPKAAESVSPKCPPAPRKPKSAPSTKRKAQRVLLDFSNEIDSLFPSNILTDFMCGKIKKVRTGMF